MGRQVRRVPADWQHPRDRDGRFIPLRDADYSVIAAAWDAGARKWDAGFVATHSALPCAPRWRPKDEFVRAESYDAWAGLRPRADAFMPTWPETERTHFQMYEVTTAGTPLSPPCASARDLAAWLATHHASAGPGFTATAAEWLAMIDGKGYSPIFTSRFGRVVSALTTSPRGYGRFFRRPRYD